MKKFEIVKYGRWVYPADVPIRITEIAGHFDKLNYDAEFDGIWACASLLFLHCKWLICG